jgi:hypothetical protein
MARAPRPSEVEKLHRQLRSGILRNHRAEVSSIEEVYRQSLSQPQANLLLGTDQRNGRPYSLPLSEWRTNMHVIGPPGSGKSMLLFILATQLILMGQSVIILDPLGPFAERVFRWLSFQRPKIQERVIVSRPGHLHTYFCGHNPCRKLYEDVDIAVQAMGLTDILARACTTNADEAPQLVKNILDFSDPLFNADLTLAELPYFTGLGKSPVRQRLALLASTPEVTREILNVDRAPLREQIPIIGSLNRRLPRIIRPTAMQAILGRTNRTLDFAELEEGKSYIGFYGGQAGVLDPRHGQVLCSLFINDLCAYLRTRTPAQVARRPVYILVDEFELVSPEGLGREMDTLRNLGARWCLSHQRLAQLVARDPDLLSAVLTDCRARFVFGGLPKEDLEILAPLMTLGDLDLKTVKDEVVLPMVAEYRDRLITSRSKASTWSESGSYGGGSNSMNGSMSSFGMTDGGLFSDPDPYGGRYGSSDFSGYSDNWMDSSSSGGMEGQTTSTILQPIIEWLRSHTTYYSRDELEYLAMAELYRQPPAHVTFRNLAEVHVPLKVTHAEDPPLREHRMDPFIEFMLTRQSHVFERQEDTLAAIKARHEALEAPPAEKEPESYLDED